MNDLFQNGLPIDVVAKLFDPLPDVVFFAKGRSGRYRAVNETLVERTGLTDKLELIGRLPSEFLGKALGGSYETQDQSVIRTGEPIEQRLELHVYPNRSVGWCLTSKYPILGSDGAIEGVAGISHDVRSPNMSRDEYDEVAGAIDWALNNLSSAPTVLDMVAHTGMSQFKLNRRFREVFGLNVGQWLVKQRVDLAQRLLRETDLPLVEIALRIGYSDQSAFTRQFRQSTNLTPRKFRTIAV